MDQPKNAEEKKLRRASLLIRYNNRSVAYILSPSNLLSRLLVISYLKKYLYNVFLVVFYTTIS